MSFGRENRHDAINIDDSSSMQDTCHMNFVIGHTQHRICGSVSEHQSTESEGLRFDSSWRLNFFSLSHTCDIKKNIFLYFFTEHKTYHLSYSV